jgi:fluoride exporter
MTGIGVLVLGGLGALCRYLVDGAVQERWEGAFPLGTFVVNLSGSLVLGAVVGAFLAHGSWPDSARLAVGTGFVGSYTTFSTFTFESFRLVREGARRYAVANLLGSLVAGGAAAAMGLWLGQRI